MERTFVAGSTNAGGRSATPAWSVPSAAAISSAATHAAVDVRAGCVTCTPHGSRSFPPLARVPSSERVMVALRFVMPVTTASGNVTGTTGVGVGSTVGVVDATAVGDVGVGVGLVVPHPARSTSAASSVALRNVALVFTTLS